MMTSIGLTATRMIRLTLALGICATTIGCATPSQTQRYFIEKSVDTPGLEPIYSTALYTVYFDHSLRRCVLHAAYSWGESGGGSGGTGLGVESFRCDPAIIRERAGELGHEVYPPKLLLSRPEPVAAAAGQDTTRGAK